MYDKLMLPRLKLFNNLELHKKKKKEKEEV